MTESSPKTKNITARDLMKQSFLRLGSAHTLREALGILLDPEARDEGPRVLVVLNPDGSFAGTLTTRFLLRGILPEWVGKEEEIADAADFEHRLLEAMQDRLEVKVGEAMNDQVPVAQPEDRLPRLIDAMLEKRVDCMPVVENERVLGVVYLTDLFNAAAQLALAAQSQGPGAPA